VVVLVGEGRVEVVVKSASLDSVVMISMEERVEGVMGMEGRVEELDGMVGVEGVVLLLRLLMLHPGGRVQDLVLMVAEVLVVVALWVVRWLAELTGAVGSS
jgi:hypothetical protein